MTTLEAETRPAPDVAPSPFALLFAPDRAIDRHARVGRALWYLLFAWVAAITLSCALSLRVDARGSTLRKLDGSGQLQGMSDRQIGEETQNAERIFIVANTAQGVLGPPFSLGLSCLGLIVLVWFFRGRLKGSAVVPVAAATTLPNSIATLLDAGSAFMHSAMPPEGVPLSPRTLSAFLALAGRPLPEPWGKLGNAVDVFSLWAAVMMGYGVIAAGQVPKRTAIVGTLVAWLCYRLLTQVAIGG